MRKKTLLTTIFLLLTIFISSCGGSSSRSTQSNVNYDNGNRDRIILETGGSCAFGAPITFNKFEVLPKIPNDWCNRQTFIAKSNNSKYIFFIGVGSSPIMEIAKESAKLRAYSNLARAIKNVITVQITTIEERLPNGTITRKIKHVLEKSIRKKVKISRTMIHAAAYKYIKIVSRNKKVYDYYVLLGMEYSLFIKHRARVLNELRKKRVAPYRVIQRITKALNNLDRSR